MNKFCDKCDAMLVNGVCPNCSRAPASTQYQQTNAQYQPQQPMVNVNPNDERFKSIFMSPKEKFVCALGNGYLINFLANGLLSKGFAVISDKRVYYKGTSFEFTGKKLTARKDARTVDLKDVTGTEVASFNPISIMVMAVMFIIAGIVLSMIGCSASSGGVGVGLFFIISVLMGGGLLITYRLVRKTLLKINYAGGYIAVPLSWYPAQEGENFQKMLRIAKDNAIEEAENATANAVRTAMSNIAPQPQAAASTADELAKYAQLYKDGLISEQEFADIKAKLLAKQ